jgi:hypothetical protein
MVYFSGFTRPQIYFTWSYFLSISTLYYLNLQRSLYKLKNTEINSISLLSIKLYLYNLVQSNISYLLFLCHYSGGASGKWISAKTAINRELHICIILYR